ncbi:TetR/AcrR family transcriptional regulator [Lentzea jiangxiensis]|uniref:DNA-binding transcriptional regulator, AcrR family n=1 Tax=Lentzea jiangxiensis TaxID=641025 RepID=A0A1H0LLP2_9PSEU|nr:TetR/AcrR family transcriptional regulator [Lentzea jiangxiensis]SDO69178.1 DNA-binding transcriptional regulator, AcrR family [Lentzea jiangxiensis]
MPRIKAASIEEHHEKVWADLTEALRHLLLERDYDSITLGHIAARAGLARNTLYNYARDKRTLVLELARRVSRPLVHRVASIAGRTAEPAADRLREIVEVVLSASTDQAMGPLFLPNSSPLVADLPAGAENPFTALVVEVRNVVRDGLDAGEFHGVDDVDLTVELLSGMMRSGTERIARDPAALVATTLAAQRIVLASLTRG